MLKIKRDDTRDGAQFVAQNKTGAKRAMEVVDALACSPPATQLGEAVGAAAELPVATWMSDQDWLRSCEGRADSGRSSVE